jgi:hypothetical protein
MPGLEPGIHVLLSGSPACTGERGDARIGNQCG